MTRYLATVHEAANYFLGITVQAIPRCNNEAADKLAKMASAGEGPLAEVFYEVLTKPSAVPEAQGAPPKAQGAAPEAEGTARLVLALETAESAPTKDW